MKTPQEIVSRHDDWTEKYTANTRSAPIRDNPLLLSLNFRSAHNSTFAAALITWRVGLGDPYPRLRKALAICQEACTTLLSGSSPEPLTSRFRFFDHVFLAILTGTTIRTEIPDILTRCHAEADVHTALDYALAFDLLSTEEPRQLRSTMSRCKFGKRLDLYRRTYETYDRLLAGELQAIVDAEDNYKARATNGYYAGGIDLEGGGPYNAIIPDYKLAAILQSRNMDAPSIHRLPLRPPTPNNP